MSIHISLCSPMSINFLHSLLVNVSLFSSISPYLYFNSPLFLLVNVCLLLSIIANVFSFSSFSSRSCLLSSRQSIHSHLTAITNVRQFTCLSLPLYVHCHLFVLDNVCSYCSVFSPNICSSSFVHNHQCLSIRLSLLATLCPLSLLVGVCPFPSELTIILFDSNDKYSISDLISFFFTQIRPASFENQLSKYYS